MQERKESVDGAGVPLLNAKKFNEAAEVFEAGLQY